MKNRNNCMLFKVPVLCLMLLFSVELCAQTHHSDAKHHIHDSLSLDEIVVEGRRRVVSTNSISTFLDNRAIKQSVGRSLASLLEETSGISSIQTGTIVAKPVINGMHGNRILLVSNGARLTGQQWGADHAPELDKNSFSSVTVVKGSESLRYGSEALGGIIVMEQSSLPYNSKGVDGSVTTFYGTNGRRFALMANAEGTMPFSKKMAWRIHGTAENGGDRSTANYLLNNTGMREYDLSMLTGYKSGGWRVELGYSLFHQKIGVMQSAQMGNEQLLRERIELGHPVEFTPFSRTIGYPHQKVVHQSLFLKANYDSHLGKFQWQTTLQSDDRKENRIRRMNHSDIPTVSLHLKSLINSLRWSKDYKSWKTEAGAQLINTNNSNERGTGVVPIIPNYAETAFGAYAVQRFITEKWSVEAGGRYDFQYTKADGYDWAGRRYGGKRDFHNFTYNVGGHYHPQSQWTITSNFGVAWRAPHVYELYSNGNELSSGMFVRGDSTMMSEQSYKWVTSLEYSADVFTFKLDGYLQWINNYIYDAPTGKNIVVVSGAYPVFQYRQTSAFFRGIDLDLRLHPVSWLDYHIVSAMIWATERSTGNYLPFIPSFRLTQNIAWRPKSRGVKPHAQLTHRYVAKQTRFNAESDLIPFTPPAYHLFGAELGIDIPIAKGQTLELALMADNIFNKEYKEYTNRSRYYAHDMGRDVRLTVTWNFK